MVVQGYQHTCQWRRYLQKEPGNEKAVRAKYTEITEKARREREQMQEELSKLRQGISSQTKQTISQQQALQQQMKAEKRL
jgi:hypothetical protein